MKEEFELVIVTITDSMKIVASMKIIRKEHNFKPNVKLSSRHKKERLRPFLLDNTMITGSLLI